MAGGLSPSDGFAGLASAVVRTFGDCISVVPMSQGPIEWLRLSPKSGAGMEMDLVFEDVGLVRVLGNGGGLDAEIGGMNCDELEGRVLGYLGYFANFGATRRTLGPICFGSVTELRSSEGAPPRSTFFIRFWPAWRV